MKPKHQRLIFIFASMLFLCISALLTLRAFRDNLIYFYSPSEVSEQHIAVGRVIRVGGLVQAGSIVRSDANHVTFDIGDGNAVLHVSYNGLLPNLFREGQGVVAEGKLTGASEFEARTILAKHDENYMPREVMDSLKRSGHWKGKPAAP